MGYYSIYNWIRGPPCRNHPFFVATQRCSFPTRGPGSSHQDLPKPIWCFLCRLGQQIFGWWFFYIPMRKKQLATPRIDWYVLIMIRYMQFYIWVVVSHIFLFSPLLGEDEPILTNIFEMGWFNHQLVNYKWISEYPTILPPKQQIYKTHQHLSRQKIEMFFWNLLKTGDFEVVSGGNRHFGGPPRTSVTNLAQGNEKKKTTDFWLINHQVL